MTMDSTAVHADRTGGGTSYPLDPLSGAEIEAAAAVIMDSEYSTPSLKFVMIQLAEPAKTRELTFDGVEVPRRAFATMYDGAAKLIYEAVVDLGARVIDSWTSVPGRFPSYLVEHMTGVEEVVRADPRWQGAMRKRGVTDFDLAMIDPWPAGYYGSQDHYENSPLICRPLTFMRAAPSEHGYARPVEGLIVTFDLDAMKVIDIEDHGVVPLPPTAGNYAEKFMFDENNRPAFTGFRDDVKPIEITQPEGPSFTVDGWKVQWQKWSMRVGFNPREGIVLHEITYPIAARRAHRVPGVIVGNGGAIRRHGTDTLEQECLRHGRGRDGLLGQSADPRLRLPWRDLLLRRDGQRLFRQCRSTIPNAICMHEEDYGISWKHTDFRTDEVEVRRSRRLVISMICTVGNYEYGFFWYFYNDASMEVEVKLSGVLTTGAVRRRQGTAVGKLVAPNIYGPNHQHFFNFRLDMSVDGAQQQRVRGRLDPRAGPGAQSASQRVDHPGHTGGLRGQGARDWNWSTGRYWKITNPSKVNELGSPVGYKLMPREVVPVMVQEGSYICDRARFVQHNLWVTKYDPAEKFAAGDYMYQSPDIQGLPSTSPTTRRWRTPTWCSGTRWARTTSSAPRTGRSCRARTPDSISNRSASSMATRRWTFRHLRPPPATITDRRADADPRLCESSCESASARWSRPPPSSERRLSCGLEFGR